MIEWTFPGKVLQFRNSCVKFLVGRTGLPANLIGGLSALAVETFHACPACGETSLQIRNKKPGIAGLFYYKILNTANFR